MHSSFHEQPFIQRRHGGESGTAAQEMSKNPVRCKTRHFSDTTINHPNTCTCRARKSRYQFCNDDLAFSLYGRTVVQPIDTERIQRKRKSSTSQWHPQPEVKEAIIHRGYSPTMTIRGSSQKPSCDSTKSDRVDINPSNAVMSFIPQVQLCMSSLPGCDFGVCARQNIPDGTVIGPYTGKRVKPEELKMGNGDCMAFLWEIYKSDKLDHYIDGTDESTSCWMRFVRSARNRKEQNLCAVQYDKDIYYRALCDISVGTELLVWYEEKYDEYFGIPVLLSYKVEQNSRKETTSSTSKSTLHQQTLSPSTMSTMNKTRLWVDLNSSAIKNDTISPTTENEYEQQQYEDVFSPPKRFLKQTPGHGAMDVKETRASSPEEIQNLIWKCNQCNVKFNQRSSLRIHVCSAKTPQPFDCGHCTLSFSDAGKLRAHVLTHTNERLFKCGYCARRFAGATTLANHVRTHTGEKPFTCEKCGKSFSQASQMSRHQRILGDCSKWLSTDFHI